MFHPKYLGAGLTLEQIELICKDEAILPVAIAFQVEATPFQASFFTTRGQANNPMTWWKALGSSSTGLQMASPTSWWRYSLQWHHLQLWSKSSVALGWLTKLRSKLGLQKAAMLVFIYSSGSQSVRYLPPGGGGKIWVDGEAKGGR